MSSRFLLVSQCTIGENEENVQPFLWDKVDGVKSRYKNRECSHWKPPKADFENEIQIRPSKKASYIPSKWVFQLDKDAVLKILTNDAYAEPLTFIRELIQNGLDAIRCQMYSDIIQIGKLPPEYPTMLDSDFREKYPLTISLAARDIVNPLSGETEPRQVLIVEDCGIGMDNDIISKYFLQVGRSYYTTEEFRRSYSFIPTSRFGVGFLSVFGGSDHVIVDTFKPSSAQSEYGIRITLTGPRHYLLTDRSDRRTNGTKIEVLLRESIGAVEFTKTIKRWCRRVEVPIIIKVLSSLS